MEGVPPSFIEDDVNLTSNQFDFQSQEDSFISELLLSPPEVPGNQSSILCNDQDGQNMVVDNNVINDSLQQTTLFPPSFRQTMPGNGYVTPNATTSQHGGFNQPGPSFSCSPVSPYQLNPNLFDPQCDNPMLPGPSMPLRDQQWTNYPLPMSNQVPAMLPGPQPPLNQWYLPHPNLSDPRCANPMLPGPSMPLRDQQWTNYQLPMRNQVPAMLPGPQPPLNQWHQYSNIHQPQPGHAYMTPNATTSEHGGFIQPGPSFPAPRSQYFSNQGHVDPAAVIPNIDNVQQENFVPGSQMDNLQVRGLQNQTAMPNASKPGLDTSLQSQNRGLNTQQVEMGGSNDSFRNYVEERADGSMKCKFCPHTYATRTSISRIKWHLSREEGHGVSICRGVAKEVQEAAWKAMCGGNKRHKITASSINVNDCGISRMVQSKDEEIDSSSRKRRKADLTAMTEPESSRSRPEGAYDVFLSFRGEDTRKTFTDHLYAALDQAGILTFRDDELPIGEDISHYILRAIQESKISIVIFSYGYASSRWCLNELVEILKCKRKKTGQIVLPIFYDIDPSDVRKQNGSFAEAFVKHEELFEEKMAKEWRKALQEAGNLSGWNLNDMENRHEAKFIKEIIKDVSNRLDPKRLHVPELLVGMDRLTHSIFYFLSTATEDVRIVAIHGMPGIGKTTLAKVVFNQLFKGFEGSCFLSDINETSKQFNGLALLQKQLLKDILKQDDANINCVDRGKVLIKERLRRKRVLVVADDVAHQDQLKALMGDRSWFGPGSRVIITTRDSNLLREVDQTYQIEELKPDESLQLFHRHAFKDTKPAEDYIELSKKAVGYCGGLPLALEVIGALLYRKNRGIWESEIDNLNRIQNQDIQGKLLISYHALGDEIQRAFLDIACFFIGKEKEYVAKVLGARCRLNPEVVLETLRERSLIKFHRRDERQLVGEMVALHDLLRDMGREVVFKASPLHLGNRTRIWNQEDAWNVLEKQKGTDDVEGLALDVRASEAKSLGARSFEEMKCLKLLQINGVHLTGSFKLLSKELMWICWHECPLKYFPSDFTWDSLAVLDMQYSNLKELWKGKKILDKLKILDLSHSQHLIKTPILHSSSLEKLILKGCSSLVEVHQSIENLTSLVFLNLEGCCSLKTLPESIGNVKSLVTLNISRCSQLEKLPERMGDTESLTELLADGIENEQFLSSIEQLKYVRRLSLRGSSLTPPSSFFISTGGLNWKRWLSTFCIEWIAMKHLKLSNAGLSDRTTSCVDFSGLSALEELDLRGNKFSSLPSGIGFLPKLRWMSVMECKYLISIPDLPSSLGCLVGSRCKSLERVRIPIESKILIILEYCLSLEEIQDIEDGSNSVWRISVDNYNHSPNKLQKSVVEAMCNGGHSYQISGIPVGNMPNWMSYSGKGWSLSFHIPPVFHGLVLWFAYPSREFNDTANIIIRNKSNGIQLFKYSRSADIDTTIRIIRYISRSEMAMEDYCAGDELELYISLVSYGHFVYRVPRVPVYPVIHFKECGVHVIAGKSDSFEESVVRRDTVMPSPPPYHLLSHLHPHCGSIRASTPKQWSDFLFAKLQEHSINLSVKVGGYPMFN